MQIKDMTKNNMIIETDVLIKTLEIKQTKKNDNYLQLSLQDHTGVIKAMIWNIDSNHKAQKLKVGDPVHIQKGTVSVFNDITSLIINEFDVDHSIDIDTLIPSAPMTAKELQYRIDQIITLIQNDDLQQITRHILDQYNDSFYTQPAATYMHHEFKGGLAYHTFCMLQAANHYAKIYPFLNTDLLYSGIILHDLGKVTEIHDYINTEKTFEGELLGHINIIIGYINDAVKELHLTNHKLITELKHIVLSHHGELEWGSNVTPRTPEAQIIHYIDQIDAKMMMFQKAFSAIDDGFTTKTFGLHNNKLYKRKETE